MDHIYQIHVRGQLSEDWADWLGGLRITRLDPGDTLLVGPLDQTALHGVLARIRDLNLTLLAVAQVGEDTATNANNQQAQGGQAHV